MLITTILFYYFTDDVQEQKFTVKNRKLNLIELDLNIN